MLKVAFGPGVCRTAARIVRAMAAIVCRTGAVDVTGRGGSVDGTVPRRRRYETIKVMVAVIKKR